MKEIVCRLTLATPAFLGEARQRAEWRTPPLKALLRQWWRVAAAQRCGFDHGKMREQEGILFGHAALKHNGRTWASRSRVSLRLENWEPGMQANPPRPDKVDHPEAEKAGRRIDPLLYLGYGPVNDRRSWLPCGSSATLHLGLRSDRGDDLHHVLRLVHFFGTIGSRSRNGWGSVEVEIDGATPSTSDLVQDIRPLLRPLEKCLDLDWPLAIGADSKGPLVWQTNKTVPTWYEAMRNLAEIKIGFRTALKVSPEPTERHVLAYPVTNHAVHAWPKEARLANSLRFKVIRKEGKFLGLAFHLPCKMPKDFQTAIQQTPVKELGVWRKVHQSLDDSMSRVKLEPPEGNRP